MRLINGSSQASKSDSVNLIHWSQFMKTCMSTWVLILNKNEKIQLNGNQIVQRRAAATPIGFVDDDNCTLYPTKCTSIIKTASLIRNLVL